MTLTGAHLPRTHRRPAKSKRDLLTALSAAATLLALVVGVPLTLLATSGRPWPAHMPTAEQIGRDLLQPDDGHVLATVLVGIAWIAWLLFTSGVVVETLGHARGTLPPRLPVISPMQQLVAPLVAAVAVLVHAPVAPLAFAASSATNAQVATAQPVAASIPAQPQADALATTSLVATVQTAGLRLYVVRPPHDGSRDTLWSIAANHLGDPLRWHEIAHLNRERVQPDGARLTDPHWIRPGWRLLLPADATDLPLAEPPHPHAPRAIQARPTEPAVPAPHDQGRQAIPQPVAPAQTTYEAGSSGDRGASQPDARDTEPALPIELTVMGVLAAGLLAILGRKRALQRRHRRTGERVRTTPAGSVPTEIRLRVAADPPAADAVTEALRALAITAHAQAEHVQAAELSGHELELLLDERAELPAPFIHVAEGIRWQFDRSLAQPQDGHSALPAMTSVGHRDGRLIFIDLERLHVLSLTGDLVAADRLLCWMAADLAAGAWAVTTNVTLVGVAPPLAVLDNERVRVFDHLTHDVVEAVESHVREFDATGQVDAVDTRSGDPLEPWPVEVVLVGAAASSSADPRLLDRVLHAATVDHRKGVAVVVVGAAHNRGTTAVIENGHIQLPHMAIEAEVAGLTQDEVRDVGQLVQAACNLDSEPDQATGTSVIPYPEDCQEPSTASSVSEGEPRLGDDTLDAQVQAYLVGDPAAVRVQLLGPVTVSAPGALEQKRLPTCTELVVYLACSPYGATLTDVDDVLWPERAVPKHTRNNVIYRARAWAGRTSDDEPRLTRVDSGGRLYLRDALVDWQLFERLLDRARKREGSERTADLRTALSLVRGKPFESIPPGRYAWLAERNLEEHMAAAVIDTAHALAAELLANGDAQAARDVARTAQMVDRHDERPWRDLLRAEAALGRTRKVKEHVQSLMRTLEVEVADELMPETAKLISELLASEPRAAIG